MRAVWWIASGLACASIACDTEKERPGRSGDRGVTVDAAAAGDGGGDVDAAADGGPDQDRGVEPDGTPPDGGGLPPDAGDAGAGIDMGSEPSDFECPACGANEMCFQFYDGTCSGGQPRCIPRVEGCAPRTCTLECQQALCSDDGVPFAFCDPGLGCGGEAEGAFVCYGP
ncbi:MAG: hypothetical protein KC583_21565 [Myxococcales bacterium]|nr:hypothetical protein [Myxococcales bacterium]